MVRIVSTVTEAVHRCYVPRVTPSDLRCLASEYCFFRRTLENTEGVLDTPLVKRSFLGALLHRPIALDAVGGYISFLLSPTPSRLLHGLLGEGDRQRAADFMLAGVYRISRPCGFEEEVEYGKPFDALHHLLPCPSSGSVSHSRYGIPAVILYVASLPIRQPEALWQVHSPGGLVAYSPLPQPHGSLPVVGICGGVRGSVHIAVSFGMQISLFLGTAPNISA